MSNKFQILRILNLCLIWVSILCKFSQLSHKFTFPTIYSSISHDSVSSHVCLFLHVFSFLSKLKFMSNKTHIPGSLILYCIWYFIHLFSHWMTNWFSPIHSLAIINSAVFVCLLFYLFLLSQLKIISNIPHSRGLKLCHIWVAILGYSHNIWQINSPQTSIHQLIHTVLAMCSLFFFFSSHNPS